MNCFSRLASDRAPSRSRVAAGGDLGQGGLTGRLPASHDEQRPPAMSELRVGDGAKKVFYL
ncbi:Leucine-rich repeat protein kinase family protein [Perilla frutescens var. frutescens]|nr:Leucine-rich repeat protein kinase family protein [Perilla frutescens var. frutescens]